MTRRWRRRRQDQQFLDRAAENALAAEREGNPYPPGSLAYEALDVRRAGARLRAQILAEAPRSWIGRRLSRWL